MTAIYAQAAVRRYVTVVDGTVTYAGEERMDGVSLGRAAGGHDFWVDSLVPPRIIERLRHCQGEWIVPAQPLAYVLDRRPEPPSIADAHRVAMATGANASVRFEFELASRCAYAESSLVPDGAYMENLGVRCRVVATSADGTAEGRAYTDSPCNDVSMLDLPAAVGRAQAEARDVAQAGRLLVDSPLAVLLAPAAAAALLHETCGHTLEADVSADNGIFLGEDVGGRLTLDELNIFDDPGSKHLWGGYSRDDEGVPAQRVPLISGGLVGEALRDITTGGAAGSNGHGRRVSHQFRSVPRMSNLVVAAGSETEEALLSNADGGVLIRSVKRAHLVPRQGVVLLYANLAHRIRGGEAAEPITGVVVRATFRELLGAIAGIGAIRESSSGHCGKAGQRIPFGALTPMLRLSEMPLLGNAVAGTR